MSTQGPYPVMPYAEPGTPSRGKSVFGWVLFIALAVMFFMLIRQRDQARAQISLNEFEALLQESKVARITIYEDSIRGSAPAAGLTTMNGVPVLGFQVAAPSGANGNWSFIQ